MTIKQQGGIFGRNPTFNDVSVEGDLTLSGSLTLPNDSISGDAIDGGNATLEGLTVGDTDRSFSGVYIVSSTSGESELRMGDTDTDAGSIAYKNSTDIMEFRAGAGPRLTLDGSGNLAPTGNVVLANGQGIDFSATSNGPNTSNELLADYEEGNWTAAFSNAAGDLAASTTLAFNSNTRYIRVGNTCHFWLATATSGTITGTAASPVYISLPFAAAYPTSGYGIYPVSVFYSTGSYNAPVLRPVRAYIRETNSYLELMREGGGTNDVQFATSGLTSGGNSNRFMISGTYKIG